MAVKRIPLFQQGEFKLASGEISKWKIDCDALSEADWDGLAAIAVNFLEPFQAVAGVPRGGQPFAKALKKHITPSRSGNLRLLVAEDVVTTGSSISKFLEKYLPKQKVNYTSISGVCVFSRGYCPSWVTPLFRMPEAQHETSG